MRRLIPNYVYRMPIRMWVAGQTAFEAMLLIAIVAVAILVMMPYVRNAVNWMWKSSSDQMDGFVPYHP